MSITRGNGMLARHMSRQVAFNAWIILMLSMLIGTYVLQMFGISLEIVRLAGGMLVAALGTALPAAIVYLCYRYATNLLARLGDIGTIVMGRFVAFILMRIGLQTMWTGWADLNTIAC